MTVRKFICLQWFIHCCDNMNPLLLLEKNVAVSALALVTLAKL